MDDNTSRTPNERLAKIVADALIEASLIAAARRDELESKIAAGTARKEDWAHWIETARVTSRKERNFDEATAN